MFNTSTAISVPTSDLAQFKPDPKVLEKASTKWTPFGHDAALQAVISSLQIRGLTLQGEPENFVSKNGGQQYLGRLTIQTAPQPGLIPLTIFLLVHNSLNQQSAFGADIAMWVRWCSNGAIGLRSLSSARRLHTGSIDAARIAILPVIDAIPLQLAAVQSRLTDLRSIPAESSLPIERIVCDAARRKIIPPKDILDAVDYYTAPHTMTKGHQELTSHEAAASYTSGSAFSLYSSLSAVLRDTCSPFNFPAQSARLDAFIDDLYGSSLASLHLTRRSTLALTPPTPEPDPSSSPTEKPYTIDTEDDRIPRGTTTLIDNPPPAEEEEEDDESLTCSECGNDLSECVCNEDAEEDEGASVDIDPSEPDEDLVSDAEDLADAPNQEHS